ncbi:MAG: cobalamin biosynthesis protein CbiD [Eubacteriaceae bacterium]|nr:cobalamin biosynthesis protein CbiD [Eubacteriaceae bacterium]
MEEYVIKDGKKLRLGYTTGSCAAAGSKAAAWMLLTGQRKEKITIMTPKGIELNLDVEDIQMSEDSVTCAILKDGGDDPDVTTGSYIYSTVSLTDKPGEVHIDGGKGVGRVTKPGLDQPVGAAAINSVPRRMIDENVREVAQLMDYTGGFNVIISIPNGEALADKTFNPRLGIVGGISVLGTSGIVEPMSEAALVDTIKVELKQRKAQGREYALLAPGNYGTEYIEHGLNIDPLVSVMTSNFIGDSIDICRDLGFKGALLVGHVGKLVKLAGNMMNTHSKYGDCRVEILSAYAGLYGITPENVAEMLECVTCDEAIRVMREQGSGIDEKVMAKVIERAEYFLNRRSSPMEIGMLIFSKKYGLLGKTSNCDTLLQKITEETQ